MVLELLKSLPSSEIQPNILIELMAAGIISHYYFIANTIIKKNQLDVKAEQLHKIKVTSSLSMFGKKIKNFPSKAFMCLSVSMIIEDNEKKMTQ